MGLTSGFILILKKSKMKHVAAYAMLVLGGTAVPEPQQVMDLLKEAGVTADKEQVEALCAASQTWEPKLLNRFDAPVWRLSWSVTGSILAVSSGDSTVTLWKQNLDGDWSQVSTVQDVPGTSASG